MDIIRKIELENQRMDLPAFRSGDTVKVHLRIVEGEKERIQVFHGNVIRIKRGTDYQSINTQGLYPGGEGAGYAGGILSAGVDGIKVAEAVALSIVARSGADLAG